MLKQVEDTSADRNRSLETTGSLTISDITDQALTLPDFHNHERIYLGEDARRGLTAIVAVHSTALGPALGGTRIWPHPTFEAALIDALRLSRGMTYKAAISGLPLGGGKAVIIADAKTQKTARMLEAYAEMLFALKETYITAEDVGMTLADADFLRSRTPNVSGTTIGGGGNPSPVTAQGTFFGLKAAVAHKFGVTSLGGMTVAVQGLGSVGWALCERLHADGAKLVVADIDTARVSHAISEFDARKAHPEAIVAADADIFAPCALGGILSEDTIPSVKATIVAGSANNQLAVQADAMRLKQRGILYAPDYLINAGGLINVAAEISPEGYDRAAVETKVAAIPMTVTEIFRRSDETGEATNSVAQKIAEERIAAAG